MRFVMAFSCSPHKKKNKHDCDGIIKNRYLYAYPSRFSFFFSMRSPTQARLRSCVSGCTHAHRRDRYPLAIGPLDISARRPTARAPIPLSRWMTSNELSDFELGHFFALLDAFAALPGRVRARLLIDDTLVPVYYSSTARTQSHREANREIDVKAMGDFFSSRITFH